MLACRNLEREIQPDCDWHDSLLISCIIRSKVYQMCAVVCTNSDMVLIVKAWNATVEQATGCHLVIIIIIIEQVLLHVQIGGVKSPNRLRPIWLHAAQAAYVHCLQMQTATICSSSAMSQIYGVVLALALLLPKWPATRKKSLASQLGMPR